MIKLDKYGCYSNCFVIVDNYRQEQKIKRERKQLDSYRIKNKKVKSFVNKRPR